MEDLVTIYFISNTENTNIKIGRSNNLKERLGTLQVANSAKLQIDYVVKNMEPSFEGYIHSLLEKYSISGEWFKREALDHLLKHTWFKENIQRVVHPI